MCWDMAGTPIGIDWVGLGAAGSERLGGGSDQRLQATLSYHPPNRASPLPQGPPGLLLGQVHGRIHAQGAVARRERGNRVGRVGARTGIEGGRCHPGFSPIGGPHTLDGCDRSHPRKELGVACATGGVNGTGLGKAFTGLDSAARYRGMQPSYLFIGAKKGNCH